MLVNSKGALISPTDVRDFKVAAKAGIAFPDMFEITAMPKVKSQGQVNSCVAHATSTILEFHDSKDNKSRNLSTNFIYGIQNVYCGHDGEGMYLRDACKIAKDLGDPEELLCKGNTEVPGAHAIAEESYADKGIMNNDSYFKIAGYARCNTTAAIKSALLNYGPVLASVYWVNDFKVDSKTGILSGPSEGDGGYHAIVIYGWNENGWLCQNSWGDDWGNKGRFIYPYTYKVAEAWSILDSEADIDSGKKPSEELKHKTSVIVKPKTNNTLDIVYKVLNEIIRIFINLFKK